MKRDSYTDILESIMDDPFYNDGDWKQPNLYDDLYDDGSDDLPENEDYLKVEDEDE